MTARENELRGYAWDHRSILKALATGPKRRAAFGLPGCKKTQMARINELIVAGKVKRVRTGNEVHYHLIGDRV